MGSLGHQTFKLNHSKLIKLKKEDEQRNNGI